LRNNTDYFLSKLFPDMSLIKYTPETEYETNNVIYKNVILYGKQFSGKTETVRAIVEKAIEKYGMENVNACVVQSGELELLIELGLNKKPIQLLFCDNLTLVKPPKQVIQNFFKIRHYYRMLTGNNNGLIITFLAAHRFHGIHIALRTDFDFLIARNSPTNPWDYNIMKRFIGEEGISIMEVLEEERFTKRDLFRFSVFYSRRKRGILELPLARKNYLKLLDYSIIKSYSLERDLQNELRTITPRF